MFPADLCRSFAVDLAASGTSSRKVRVIFNVFYVHLLRITIFSHPQLHD